MRLVVGVASINRGVSRLSNHPSIVLAVLTALSIGAGLLLLAGFWTPIAGMLVAAINVWKIFLLPENLWIYTLLATLGAALALIGPGAWSVDARLFGWKRIDIPDRKR
jgi:putative oxidoreductase